MSRFLKVMIVLLAIAAMAVPSVFAEDRLSLNGSMRVRGAYIDDGGDHSKTTVDHRLRIGGKFSIAEGVSITFRTDVSEGTWGSDSAYGRFGSVTAWDRAHIDLDGDKYHFRVGTQNIFWGNSGVDAQDTAALFTIKGAVPVDLIFSLLENNDDSDLDINESDDFLYGARIGHKGDNYAAKLFVAGYKASDTDINMVGATLSYDFEAFKLDAEAEFFTGDADADMDAMGTQIVVDASMAASESTTVGAKVYYAIGADDDEVQVTYLGNRFNDWDGFNYGPFQNENLVVVEPFDAFDDDAGVMAIQGYASVKVNDPTTFTASLAYLEPEEDANTDADSAMAANLGLTYKLMANTTLKGQFQYIDIDQDDVDEITAVGLGLWVNF